MNLNFKREKKIPLLFIGQISKIGLSTIILLYTMVLNYYKLVNVFVL